MIKRGVIIFVFLVLSISYITALNSATQPASSIVVSVGGSALNLDSSLSTFIGTHTYSSVSNLSIGQHDASRILVSVKDGEMTLLQALQSTNKLCPASTIKNSYTKLTPNPGHNGTDVILSSGKKLQKAIDDGDFCGCVPNEVKACGINNTCGTFPTVTCTSAGTWPACGPSTVAPRGKSCTDSRHACDGAGNCLGWSGSGCSSSPTGTTRFGGNRCLKLSDSSGYYVGTNDLDDGWFVYNYFVQCEHSCHCPTSGSCDTCDNTWYIKPGTAAVDNSCTLSGTGSGDGHSAPTTNPSEPTQCAGCEPDSGGGTAYA